MAETGLNTIPVQMPIATTQGLPVRSAVDLYDPARFAGLAVLAGNLFRSGLYSPKTQEQLFVILQMGMELNLPPTSAVSWIDVIKGKPVMNGKGMMAMVTARGHKCEILEETETRNVFRFTRGDTGLVRTTTYTEADAKAAGLLGNENYSKYRRTMLLNRNISANLRYSAGDVLGGLVYTPEDFGAISTSHVMLPGAFPPIAMDPEERVDDDRDLVVHQMNAQLKEVWDPLFQQLKDILKEANTHPDKILEKLAQAQADFDKDRAKAIPALTKYLGTLRKALDKKKAEKPPVDLEALMLTHLKATAVEGQNPEAFVSSLVEAWMEDYGGDLAAVEEKKRAWLIAEGVEVPQ